MSAPTLDVARLRRIQTGARATLALGIGASLAANMLAAHPSLIGRLVAGWSPVALMLTVELLSRVPASGGRLSRVRVVAAGVIAGIAAWVSYWHMVQVSLAAGEAPVAAHLLPISVDGLVVVASICLVEITNRLAPRAAATARPKASTALTSAAPASALPAPPPVRAQTAGERAAAAEVVRQLAAEHPEWTQAQVAEAAGCSVRTVRRHLTARTASQPALNHDLPEPVAELFDDLAPVAARNGSAP